MLYEVSKYKYEKPCLPYLVDLLNSKNNFARVAGRNAHPKEENHREVAHKDLEFAALVRNLLILLVFIGGEVSILLESSQESKFLFRKVI